MPWTPSQLDEQKNRFTRRTAEFAQVGFDRFGAPEFILDQAGPLSGPVLDVGSGMGITARALATRGLDVVSVDLNADDQQVAAHLTDLPEHQARIDYLPCDAACLPFAAGHFGAAVAIDVLHHLEAGGPVLREMVRLVAPGGLIVLADFSTEGFDMVSRVHAAENRVHPVGPVTVDWARGFMSALGAAERRLTEGHLHRVAVFRTPPSPPAAPTRLS